MTQTVQQVILRKKASGVAIVLIDCQGKLNSLNAEVTDELKQALGDVEHDRSVRALVIVSGKPDTFLSGADLRQISKLTDVDHARQLSRNGHEILDRLAALPIPTVVGINGVCLGGGLELALACNYRIATADEKTLLGLPEVRLGILPGMGGTQRLPRLIGLQAALELILSAEPVSAARALELGLVDRLVSADDLLVECERLALELSSDKEKGKLQERKDRSAELDANKRDKVLAMAERSMRMRTKGHYPAPSKAVEAVRVGLQRGVQAGLEHEAAAFAELAVTDTAKNLIALFFNTEFARSTAAVMSARMQAKPVSTLAVVGSGVMGLAIAQMAVLSGYQVIFRPTNRNPEDHPAEKLTSLIARGSGKNKLTEAELDRAMKRIVFATEDKDLANADLVIEAVFEDEELKTQLFERLEKIVSPECTIATNTSSLSVSKLASRLAESGRFLGMHFFLPVERMPLVEVISHRATKRDAIARAAQVISSLGKIPAMVNDGPGFLVNRLLCTYIFEAARLAESGVALNWLDDAAVDFGMAMGPLVVLDEVGLDVAFKVADSLNEGLGSRFAPSAVIGKSKALGLVGKKSGVGVYQYDETGKKLHVNARLINELGLHESETKPDAACAADIAERLILPMIDEAARCLQDKIVRKPREVDLAMVLGTGFPAFRGGPLKYADGLGMSKLVDRLEQIYESDGSKRTVSDLIKTMQAEGRRFYSRSADNEDA